MLVWLAWLLFQGRSEDLCHRESLLGKRVTSLVWGCLSIRPIVPRIQCECRKAGKETDARSMQRGHILYWPYLPTGHLQAHSLQQKWALSPVTQSLWYIIPPTPDGPKSAAHLQRCACPYWHRSRVPSRRANSQGQSQQYHRSPSVAFLTLPLARMAKPPPSVLFLSKWYRLRGQRPGLDLSGGITAPHPLSLSRGKKDWRWVFGIFFNLGWDLTKGTWESKAGMGGGGSLNWLRGTYGLGEGRPGPLGTCPGMPVSQWKAFVCVCYCFACLKRSISISKRHFRFPCRYQKNDKGEIGGMFSNERLLLDDSNESGERMGIRYTENRGARSL